MACRITRNTAQHQDRRRRRVANRNVVSDDLPNCVGSRTVAGQAGHQRDSEQAEAHCPDGGQHTAARELRYVGNSKVAHHLNNASRHRDEEGCVAVESHPADELREEYGDASARNIDRHQEEEYQIRLRLVSIIAQSTSSPRTGILTRTSANASRN